MNILLNLYNLLTNKIYFRIAYLLINLTTITMLRFIPGIHLVNKIIIIWGLALIGINLIEKISKKQFPAKIDILIYTFLSIISIFTLIKYPTINNIKILLVNFMILTIFFDIDTNKSINKLKQELNLFSLVYFFSTFLLSLISLFIILSKKTIWISETLNKEYISYGLTSLFLNENSLGISAVLSLMISIYLLSTFKEKFVYKLLLYTNIILQFVTLILSNSRSVYLGLLAFIFIFICFYLKNTLLRICFLLTSIISATMIIITKKDSLSSILTGRDILWDLSFQAIKSNFLFGVGSDNLSNILAEKNVLTLGRVHNIYIELWATNGTLALILFILILLSMYIFLFQKIIRLKSNKFTYTTLFSLTVSILFINMVESSLIYIISFISIIFWTILSYTISILSKDV